MVDDEWGDLDARLERKKRLRLRQQQREWKKQQRELQALERERRQLQQRCDEMAREDRLSVEMMAWHSQQEAAKAREMQRQRDWALYGDVVALRRRAKTLGVSQSTPGLAEGFCNLLLEEQEGYGDYIAFAKREFAEDMVMFWIAPCAVASSPTAINQSVIFVLHRMQRLRAAFDARRFVPMTETSWLGWRLQHSLSPTDDHRVMLRLRFSRRLPRHKASIDEIHKASWRLLSCEHQNTRLYSSLVFAKIVQHVGEDTFVFLRNAPDKHRRVNVRYFSLTTQMEFRTDANERGILTLMSCLDKEPLVNGAERATPPVVWLKNGCEYIALTESSTRQSGETEDMVEIEFGGAIRCESEEQARFLLVEIPGILMRWESLVLPSPLAF
ncbi:hypothetical protein ATCC90586_007418 [Pythium insidiosum]|nr:hypothetical protein ATCC90586_007418 [Pythium insidiosum]